MSLRIDIKEIDPLLQLVDDPVALLRRWWFGNDKKVLRAKKEAYSQGFEVGSISNCNHKKHKDFDFTVDRYKQGYNAGYVAARRKIKPNRQQG